MCLMCFEMIMVSWVWLELFSSGQMCVLKKIISFGVITLFNIIMGSVFGSNLCKLQNVPVNAHSSCPAMSTSLSTCS